MNGESLPVEHGFPLRVVVPGWAGDSWIKWVTSISVLDRDHEGFWMARAYRHPGKPVPAGHGRRPRADAAGHQPAREERDRRSARRLSGRRRHASHDSRRGLERRCGPCHRRGGERRRRTQLERRRHAPRSANGVRLAALGVSVDAVSRGLPHVLARARDAAGNTQPFDQEWNPSGYAWNVVPRVGVNVVSTALGRGTAGPASGAGHRAAIRIQERVPRLP